MRIRVHLNRRLLLVWTGLLALVLLSLSVRWISKQFGRINFDEIALVLQVGINGTDSGLFWSFFEKVIVRAFFVSGALAVLCGVFARYKFFTPVCFLVVFGVLVARVCTGNVQIGSFFQTQVSDFYEREYIDPNDVVIRFPKQRRNVLMIVLESVEKSYANPDLFGDGGLTPNITKLENNHISFERYEVLYGLSHTIAAITGMTAGLPLFFTGSKRIEKMLGASGLGTIFLKNGYQTWSFFPASGEFSLKEKFLHRMGFENIYDGLKFKSMLNHPLDVEPFHGVDDATLFRLSRPIIADIIRSSQPYFILMETINTHCEGYFTQACRDMGFAQETMADIFKCEDYMIADFVKWFRAQDPDAVVILIDDHTLHSGDELLNKLDNLPVRPLANVFINTNVFYGTDTVRPVAAFDFLPTIVEAAGGEVPGCRLGLGTALTARCIEVPTLREKYGDNDLQRLMEQRNNLYYRLVTGEEK